MNTMFELKDPRYLPKWPRLPWPESPEFRETRQHPDLENAFCLVEDVWACAYLTNKERGLLCLVARVLEDSWHRGIGAAAPGEGWKSAYVQALLAEATTIKKKYSFDCGCNPYLGDDAADELI